MDTDTTSDEALLQRFENGDEPAFTELMSRHEQRLLRMVRLRMNQQLAGRVDDSDILQEAILYASQHVAEYNREPALPVFLWLRHITMQKLIDAHRRHLGAQKRDANLEVSVDQRGPQVSSACLAAHLIGGLTSPSHAAMRAEVCLRVQEALNSLQAIDREILAMRHFEQLNNVETALALQIDRSTASSRYLSALKRMKAVLGEVQEDI